MLWNLNFGEGAGESPAP